MIKLKADDSNLNIATKMAEGNFGALSFIMGILKQDDDNVYYLIDCDNLGIYGSRLYQLWNDCCQRDNNKVFKVLDKYKNGEFTKEFIYDCIDQPYGKNIDI